MYLPILLDSRRPVHPPSGAEVIELGGRDSHLPEFYRVRSHPLLAHVENVRNVYIYLHDTDKQATLDFLKFAKGFQLLDGTKEGVDGAGTFYGGEVFVHAIIASRFSGD